MRAATAAVWSLTLLLAAAVGFVRARPQVVEHPPRITWDDVYAEDESIYGHDGPPGWARGDLKGMGWSDHPIRSRSAPDLERVTAVAESVLWVAGKRGSDAVIVCLSDDMQESRHVRLGELVLPTGCVLVGLCWSKERNCGYAADAGNACVWRVHGHDERGVPTKADLYAKMPRSDPWFNGHCVDVDARAGILWIQEALAGCCVMGTERILLLDDKDGDGQVERIRHTTMGFDYSCSASRVGPGPRRQPHAGRRSFRYEPPTYQRVAPEVWLVDGQGALLSVHAARARIDIIGGATASTSGPSETLVVPLRRALRKGEAIRLRDPTTGYWGSVVHVLDQAPPSEDL